MGNQNTGFCNKSFSSEYRASLAPQAIITSNHYSKAVNKDHFSIVKVIGRGSFGKVFLV